MNIPKYRKISTVLRSFGFVGFLLLSLTTYGLITTGGKEPVADYGWPEGTLAVANLESRVSWWEGPPFGGGERQFLYRGDSDAFNEALKNFAAIRAPQLDLVIHDGPMTIDVVGGARVDWTFTVWIPASWHRLYNNPKLSFTASSPGFRQPVDPPRVDVYLGGDGLVDWTKVVVPPALHVRDERASASGVEPVGGALVRAEAYDMATGKVIRGSRLMVAKPPESPTLGRSYQPISETTADAEGRIEASKILAGTYRLTLEATGYASRVLDHGQFSARTFKRYSVELSKASTVRGMVLDTAGAAISNAVVSASVVMGIDGRGYDLPETPQATTDASGHFELTPLPTGYVQLRANAPGYSFRDVFNIQDTPATNVVLRVARAGTIQVTVSDKSGNALSQYEGSPLIVNLEQKGDLGPGSWGGSITVQTNGACEFVDVPPGEYRLTSRPNPAHSSRPFAPAQSATVLPGVPVTVNFVYE